MSNQLSALLSAWQAGNEDTDWVLGTVYKTEGSAYRKAGAMMLINGFAQQFGLLSGGCLEADIVRNARKVMRSGEVSMLVYDGSDEDDWAYQLGIGCGGKIHIMLQPISNKNDLGLADMAAALKQRTSGVYHQKIGQANAYFECAKKSVSIKNHIDRRRDGDWLVTAINPEPHLLIIGGGIDARPVVNIADELGWRITLVDPRPANARIEHFRNATNILREIDDGLSRYIREERVDAAIIMSHNIDIDAKGLRYCQNTFLRYVALLGPTHRFRQVLDRARLTAQQLTCPVSAPAGLDIGGQLPESIALSILAECHSVLNQSERRLPQQLAVV